MDTAGRRALLAGCSLVAAGAFGGIAALLAHVRTNLAGSSVTDVASQRSAFGALVALVALVEVWDETLNPKS